VNALALIDRKSYQVTLGDQSHSLASREMKLLEIFHTRRHRGSC
jgi:hypothetical protein